MSKSSNHSKVFVHWCHGKHTVASSRTVLSVHVRKIDTLKQYSVQLMAFAWFVSLRSCNIIIIIIIIISSSSSSSSSIIIIVYGTLK